MCHVPETVLGLAVVQLAKPRDRPASFLEVSSLLGDPATGPPRCPLMHAQRGPQAGLCGTSGRRPKLGYLGPGKPRVGTRGAAGPVAAVAAQSRDVLKATGWQAREGDRRASDHPHRAQ